MAYALPGETRRPPTPSVSRHSPLIALSLVGLSKAADAATTWVGLQAGLVEMNPLARTVMDALGTAPAIVLLSVVATATTVGLIEGASTVFRRIDAVAKFVPWWRVSCYLLAVTVNVIVASHNLALVLGWV